MSIHISLLERPLLYKVLTMDHSDTGEVSKGAGTVRLGHYSQGSTGIGQQAHVPCFNLSIAIVILSSYRTRNNKTA